MLGFNSRAKNVCIKGIEEVDIDFNSRFNAKKKTYVYILNDNEYVSTLTKNREYFVGKELDVKKMKDAAKYITGEQVEKKYKIIDHIWFNEQKWDIFQRSDDNLDKPNSWVTIVSDDIEFLNRNGLWKKENLVESRYGHLYYCSLPIEAEKFSLIRTRKNLPI